MLPWLMKVLKKHNIITGMINMLDIHLITKFIIQTVKNIRILPIVMMMKIQNLKLFGILLLQP